MECFTLKTALGDLVCKGITYKEDYRVIDVVLRSGEASLPLLSVTVDQRTPESVVLKSNLWHIVGNGPQVEPLFTHLVTRDATEKYFENALTWILAFDSPARSSDNEPERKDA